MSNAVSLYDLFTLGLALELGGAALLVRATFLSPHRIFVDNALWGSPYYRVVSATRSRIESLVGFSGLLIGFLVQLAGYAAYLWRGGHVAFGHQAAVLAVVVALVVAPIWFALGRLVTKLAFRPLLVRVAKQRADDTPLDHPRADSLVRWGKAAGIAERANEDVPAFLLRVFKVRVSVLPQVGGVFVPIDQVPVDDWPKFDE